MSLQSFLDSITSREAAAAGSGVAAGVDPNGPDLAELVDASADRAEFAGDGPDVEPVYEPPRPVAHEVIEPVTRTAPVVVIGAPIPAASVAVSSAPAQAVPTRLLDAAGGRPRRVRIVNTDEAAAVYLSPDRREDSSGYALAAGATLETETQGEVWQYRAASGSGTVSAWVDYYPAPTKG